MPPELLAGEHVGEVHLDAHRFHLGGSTLLPWDITVDVQGTYSYQPHDDPSSFDDVPARLAGQVPSFGARRRVDHVWTSTAAFARRINEYLTVSARYHYLHSNSRANLFEYDRHIAGTYLNFALP